MDTTLVVTYTHLISGTTLSARPIADIVQIEDLDEALASIGLFIQAIENELHHPIEKRQSFVERIAKNVPNNIKVRFLYGPTDIVVTDATYNKNTGNITFDPRVTVTMPYACFVGWYQFLRRFSSEIKQF